MAFDACALAGPGITEIYLPAPPGADAREGSNAVTGPIRRTP